MSTRAKIVAGGIAVVLVAALGWWKLSGSRDQASKGDGGDAAERSASSISGRDDGGDPEPATIHGTITSTGGEPVAAVVRIAGDGQTEITRAGPDGRFEVTGLAPGSVRVSAAAAGFRPTISGPVVLPAGGVERVDLGLEPGGRRVAGRVVDISGGPVAGAFVELTPIAGILEPVPERGFAAITGTDGRFEASAEDGVYVLSARHPDYVSGAERVEIRGAAPEIEIALIPGGVIEGVVVDARSGEPVAGAAVTFGRSALLRIPGAPRQSESIDRGAVTADGRGAFRITGLEPGVISLRAAGAGRVSREPVAVSMGIAESRSGVEIHVDAGFHIRGVVKSSTGAPVPGASVNASTEGGGEEATSDDQGRFDIGPLAPGDYALFAMGGDIIGGFMSREDVSIDGADVDGVVLEVNTGVRIRGRVSPPAIASVRIDPGRQAPGGGFALLSLLGGVQTEADGVFDIGPVTPGRSLVLEAISDDGRRGEIEVDVGERGAAGVVIELGAAARIAGRVTDQRGRPVAGVFVAANPSGATSRRVIVNGAEVSGRRVTTGVDGAYAIAGLDAGAYQVSVSDARGQRLSEPTRVELAEREERTVDLSIKALDGVIRGVVLGPDRRPAADVFVTATPSRSLLAHRDPKAPRSESMMVVVSSGGGGGVPMGGSMPPVVTGADGRFEIRGLREGDYDLVAEGLGGSARALSDKIATGSEVTIELVSLTALAGRVTKNGDPVKRFTVELTGPARFARGFRTGDGSFRMPRLDPGRYQLRVRGGGGEASMDVDVAAGRTTEVEVALEGQHKIRGRLVDAGGNPVARAMVLITPTQPDGETEIRITSSTPPPRSGDDGRFVTAALPGSYTLIALAPDAPRPLARATFELEGDLDLGDIPATGAID